MQRWRPRTQAVKEGAGMAMMMADVVRRAGTSIAVVGYV